MNNELAERIEQAGAGVIYDKTGREIVLGDIVKVYHFTAALRRKRHYMYKQALNIREWPSGARAIFFSHQTMKENDGYYQMLDGRVLDRYEIVQSIDARFEDRPRRLDLVAAASLRAAHAKESE